MQGLGRSVEMQGPEFSPRARLPAVEVAQLGMKEGWLPTRKGPGLRSGTPTPAWNPAETARRDQTPLQTPPMLSMTSRSQPTLPE